VNEQSQREAIYPKFIDRATYNPQPGVEVRYVDLQGNIVFRKDDIELAIVRGAWTLSFWRQSATI
jgi:hypothetical protein